MRNIILAEGEKGEPGHARRIEKRMVEVWDRRILEFALHVDAREVAKELKHKG